MGGGIREWEGVRAQLNNNSETRFKNITKYGFEGFYKVLERFSEDLEVFQAGLNMVCIVLESFKYFLKGFG